MMVLPSTLFLFLILSGVVAVVVAGDKADDDYEPAAPLAYISPLVAKNYNSSRASNGGPPYWGTVFMDGDIINDDEHPSSLQKIETFQNDEHCVRIYNRRNDKFEQVTAYIYHVTFDDKVQSQFWVRTSDFNREQGLKEVIKGAHSLGQLPQFLRRGSTVVSIQKGDAGWGGDRDGLITVHVDWHGLDAANAGTSRDIYAEILIHEAAHAVLDEEIYGTNKWNQAVNADGEFISTYARDYPRREDVAESILPWLGVAIGSLNNADRTTTQQTIPNRLAYFDDQDFNLYPLGDSESTIDDYEYREIHSYWLPCGSINGGDAIKLPVVCKDNHEFRFNNNPALTCQNWLQFNTSTRCQREWNGKLVKKWCPNSCSKVGLGPCCKDSKDFRFENRPKVDCARFLKKKPNKRCRRNWKGLAVSDWCPQTCAKVGQGPCAE